ncbi:SdrD B-like domain-containing protein [Hamadaea sp. NPDC051192]|uniref:SdrD B-like domain-containing protein n=1 Tax=Hamadaea sp. NPDC051192 TaxID=3154940 RepID=UPI00342F5362
MGLHGANSRRPFWRKRTIALACALGLGIGGTVAFMGVAFGASGTLTSQLVLVSSGSRPFDPASGPGKDDSPIDEVVRTSDTVTYRVDLSSRGTVDEATATLAVAGPASFQTVPSLCTNRDDAISRDGKEISCDIGAQTNQTNGVEFSLKVDGDAANGAEVKTTGTVSGQGVAAVPAGESTVVVSAAPEWDLSATEAQPLITGGAREGVYGNFIAFPLAILHRGPGVRGVEALNPALSFGVDLSHLYEAEAPGTGDWQLVGCSPNGVGDPVFPSLPGTRDFGTPATIGCTRTNDTVDVVLDGLDTSMKQTPLHTYGNLPLPLETTYAFAGKLVVFIPGDDLLKFGESKQGVNFLRLRTELPRLAVKSISGALNEGDLPANNAASTELNDAAAGEIATLFGSEMANGDATMVAPGRETPLDRKGKITPGTKYTVQVVSKNLGTVAHGEPGRVCAVFDNAVQQPTGQYAAVAALADGGKEPVPGAQLSWGVGTEPVGPASGCGDEEATWYPSLDAVPGGAAEVDRARWIITEPQPVGSYYRFVLEEKISPSATDGTEVKTWGRASWAGRHGGAEERPAPDDISAVGPMSDRMIVLASAARVTVKTAETGDSAERPSDDLQSVQPDQPVRFIVQATLTDSTAKVGRACPVSVDVTIPAQVRVVDAAATLAPTATKKLPDGSTSLHWDLGERHINELLPAIDLRTSVAKDVAAGHDLTAVATISTACDVSPAEDRTASRSLTVTGQGAYRVVIEAGAPAVAVGDDVSFLLKETNAWTSPVRSSDLIMKVPASGDVANTAVTGPVVLEKVQPPAGATVRYTAVPGDRIDLDVNDKTNQPGGDTAWCLADEFGQERCPEKMAAVTGIRVSSSTPLAANGTRVTTVVLDAPQSKDAEELGAVFGAKADGLALPVRSNDLTVRMLAGSVSGRVWRDLDRDGVRDDSEPNLAGIPVKLTGSPENCATVERRATTDAQGRYRFAELCPGTYEVDLDAPAGSKFTTENAVTDPQRDSNVNATGTSAPLAVRRMFVAAPTGQQLNDVSDLPAIDAGLITEAAAATPTPATSGGAPVPTTAPGGSATPSTGSSVDPVGASSTAVAAPTSGTTPGSGPSGATPSAGSLSAGATPGASATDDPGVSTLEAPVSPTATDGSSTGTDGTGSTTDGTDPSSTSAATSGDDLPHTGTPGWLWPSVFTGIAAVLIGSVLLVITLRRRRFE